MPAKSFASTRYTELNEINAQNAKQLRVEFTFSTGVVRGHEAAPLVVNDTIYIVSREDRSSTSTVSMINGCVRSRSACK